MKYRKWQHMKKMITTVSYDKEFDILFIHKGFSSDEQFTCNLDLGDLILDISTKQRVRGLEIMNASRFLKEFSIDERYLCYIQDVDFKAILKPQSIVISLLLKSNKMEIPVKIAVPLLKH